MSVDAFKKQLRQQIKLEKKQLKEKQSRMLAAELFEKLERMPEFIHAQHVLCYWSLPDELSTHLFIDRWFRKKNFYLPRVIGDDLEVVPYLGQESMMMGPYNILEPSGSPIENLDEIDVVIVPGVAFSTDGSRLGRGGGYYDRFLLKMPNSIKMGVAYKFQIKIQVPSQVHDIKMDRVLFCDTM